MSLSLRWRITLGFVAAFILTLGLIFVTLHVALQRILRADLDAELSGSASALAATITPDDQLAPPGAILAAVTSASLERLAGSPLITVVLTEDGNVLAASSRIPLDVLALPPGELDRLRGGSEMYRTVRTAGDQELRQYVRPVIVDGQMVAAVSTATPLRPVTRATDTLQYVLVAEALVAAAAATAVGYLVARQGLRPLDTATALAADIEAHDLTRRLGLTRAPAEIRRLADTFDAMLTRLERAFDLQRSFALDVAHELRTPLTALRGHLDVLLLDPALDGDVRQEIEQLSAETGRMMRLTSNLLSLAQAEAGRQIERRPVDLDLICLEVYQQARTLHPGVRLRLGHEDQVTVSGDRDLLKQLILNLVENGLKYTPEGGTVTLSLFQMADSALVEVADTGPGITPEHRERIFERFYRAPVGGGRLTGGAGIGLSVVQWIAEQHGGRIDVESRPGHGSTFKVILPNDGVAAADSPDSNGRLTGA